MGTVYFSHSEDLGLAPVLFFVGFLKEGSSRQSMTRQRRWPTRPSRMDVTLAIDHAAHSEETRILLLPLCPTTPRCGTRTFFSEIEKMTSSLATSTNRASRRPRCFTSDLWVSCAASRTLDLAAAERLGASPSSSGEDCSIHRFFAIGVPRIWTCRDICSLKRRKSLMASEWVLSQAFFWSKSRTSSTLYCSLKPLGMADCTLPPMESVDLYELEPGERAKARRKGRTPPRVHDRTEEAYDYIRRRLDLGYPFTITPYSNIALSRFPSWAVNRALAKMVKDGVLKGPIPVPKTKKGEIVWYRMMIGDMESGWIMWAEGHWRKWHMNDKREWLIRRAKQMKNAMVRMANPSPGWDWKTKAFRPLEKKRSPSTSKTASLREFIRSIPSVRWDGMAYYPVAGEAMEELKAWRKSLPADDGGQPTPYKSRPSGRRVKQTRCRRCGNVFYCSFGYMKKIHKPEQCSLLVVTRIMES